MDTYNPEQAAAVIGNVSASTIRNWCKSYGPVLSAGANPPVGTERRLTQQDIAALQQIKLMRDNKRTVQEIVATLQQAATKQENQAITIEAVATPATIPQEARSDALMPLALVVDLQGRLQALEKQQRDPVSMLITGIVIGAAITLIVVAMALGMLR